MACMNQSLTTTYGIGTHKIRPGKEFILDSQNIAGLRHGLQPSLHWEMLK